LNTKEKSFKSLRESQQQKHIQEPIPNVPTPSN